MKINKNRYCPEEFELTHLDCRGSIVITHFYWIMQGG